MKIDNSAKQLARGIGLELDELSSAQQEELAKMSGSDGITGADLRAAMEELQRGNARWLKGAMRQGPREVKLPKDGGASLNNVLEAMNSDSEAVRNRAKQQLDTLLKSPQTRDRASDQLADLFARNEVKSPFKLMDRLEETEQYGVLGELTGKVAQQASGRGRWEKTDSMGWHDNLIERSLTLLESGNLDGSERKMLAGAMLRGETPSMKAYQAGQGGDVFMGGASAKPEIFRHVREVALDRGISTDGLHRAVEGTEMEAAVKAAQMGKPPMVERETKQALRSFDSKLADEYQTQLKAQMKQRGALTKFRIDGRRPIQASEINSAIRDGELDQLIGRIKDGPGKLKLYMKLRAMKTKAEKMGGPGFDVKEGKLKQVDGAMRKLMADPSVQATLESARSKAAAEALGIDPGEASDYAERLGNYLSSESFRSRLDSLPEGEARELVAKRMKVLGALDSEKAEEALLELNGKQFLNKRVENLQKVPREKRAEAVQSTLTEALGWSKASVETTTAIADALGQLGEGVNADSPEFARKLKSAIEETAGSPTQAGAALELVDKLRKNDKLSMFMTATTVFSLDMPNNFKGMLEQGGNVAGLIGETSNLAKMLGHGDDVGDLADVAKFGNTSAGKFVEFMGPAGDVLGAAVDGIEMVEEIQKNDAGEAIGKGIAAGGGLISAGLAITGSTGWTGAGALIGLGTAGVGLLVESVYGETDMESNLENSGMIEDLDADWVPGI